MGDFDNRRAMDLIDKAIKKAVDKYQCNICCIVIPNPLKTQYPRIKKLALIDNNMVCQIVTDATLRKKNLQSIATKVLLQIIAKRGNTLWVPKSKSSFDGIMLAAFDHAKVSGNKFMLALCATINSTFTSIASRSGAYDGNSNKFQLMCNQFLSVIDAYTTRNEVPPK
jgi:argonaute-like protein implicated in RNA metabolism and viral defense